MLLYPDRRRSSLIGIRLLILKCLALGCVAFSCPFIAVVQSQDTRSDVDSSERVAGKPPTIDTTEGLDVRDGKGLLLRQFRPKSQLVVPMTDLRRAKFPVVDVHSHFFHRLKGNSSALDDFVRLMDRNNIAVCVSLDGKLGHQLDEHLKHLWQKHKDRFVVFANVDWIGDGNRDEPATWACHRRGFAARTAAELETAVRRGVSGLKVFKRFGLSYRNPDGTLMKIDDSRWDPIWQACGSLKVPVIIHTGDPAAFFEPIDEKNERWEELSRHPEWSFHGDEYPSREELLAARNRVIARHPNTQFIGAHMAGNSEDLVRVAEWLRLYPNLWVEPASRIGELGRQPYTARDFLIRHADRIIFGTDGPWPETRIRFYWRFFETRDEYFPYSEKIPPPQGLWQIYGVHLPDDVLRKIYFQNAARLVPGVRSRVDRFIARNVSGESESSNTPAESTGKQH